MFKYLGVDNDISSRIYMQETVIRDDIWRCNILRYVCQNKGDLCLCYPNDIDSVLLCVKSIQYSNVFPSFVPCEGAGIILEHLCSNATRNDLVSRKKGQRHKRKFHYRNSSGRKSPFLSRHRGHHRRSWVG